MKIGISTACFYPSYIEDSVEQIAKLGFKDIEIFVNSESEFSNQYIKALSKVLRSYDITVVSVHPFTSAVEGLFLFSEYQRRTDDCLDQYERYFEASGELGAKYFTFHGERNIPLSQSSRSLGDRRIEVYEQLCDRADKHGIVVAQENVDWCKSRDPEFLSMLASNVTRLGFTLDIKQAHRSGHHWREYTEALGNRITNIHINDFDEQHSCLLPGEGNMEFDNFFSTMHDIGYSGMALIEVYSNNFKTGEQVSRAADFLRGFNQEF